MATNAYTPVIAPDLGATARLSGWLVEIGERVHAGDRLVELLLPGLTYDVPAPATGQLVQTAITAGDVRPGDHLGTIEADAE